MTAEVFVPSVPNPVEFVIAWLRGLGVETDVKRPAGAALPYYMVNGIDESDDWENYEDIAVVSVHTFGETYAIANDAATMAHQRMLMLIDDPLLDVTLTAGVANADYVETAQKPIWVFYDDTLDRFVARYQLSLQFTGTPRRV